MRTPNRAVRAGKRIWMVYDTKIDCYWLWTAASTRKECAKIAGALGEPGRRKITYVFAVPRTRIVVR